MNILFLRTNIEILHNDNPLIWPWSDKDKFFFFSKIFSSCGGGSGMIEVIHLLRDDSNFNLFLFTRFPPTNVTTVKKESRILWLVGGTGSFFLRTLLGFFWLAPTDTHK